MNSPIVIAGGGTGGHVFVAEAVASALVKAGEPKASLAFVGSRRGQERTLLADTGISLTLLPGRGLKRSLTPKDVLDNAAAAIGLGVAIVSMVLRFASWRPRAVVSVGGYAALPAGLAAGLWRRPLILVNIDAIPGSTHRFLAHFAIASCVISTSTLLPNPTLTGAPVRSDLEDLDRSRTARDSARSALNCDPARPFLAVVTGSLGARSVNMAVEELCHAWRDRELTIYHVTGTRDAREIRAKAPAGEMNLDYRIIEFEHQMNLVYQASDIVLCRAGALTIAEIGVVGVCAVLVPLPGAPGDHQTKNAQALVASGAGILIPDAQISSERLNDVLGDLLDDPRERERMEASAKAFGHPHAADSVATVVLNHV